MAQYLVKLRRGVKDDASGRNDWATYEAQPKHLLLLEGELVLEYDNGIPRLKIGNGKRKFSELPYMRHFLPQKPSLTKLIRLIIFRYLLATKRSLFKQFKQ